MERMLDEPYDVLTDYTHVPSEADDADGLRVVRTFASDDLQTRSVTDVDWSAKHPELVVAAYNRRRAPTQSGDHDGLVCVWNLHVHDRPEFVFRAPTDVVAVAASPFHPHLVLGGTFSGEVLLWDMRHRGLPVQRTPHAFSAPSGITHGAPVYTLRLAGHAHAHHLVSASSDGVVCTWSLDMLARPQTSLQLTNAMHPRSAKVHVTALDVASSDASHFHVGTSEGAVFDAQNVDRGGMPAGLDTSHVYVAHTAPITRLETHPAHMHGERLPPAVADLVLTASMDGTTSIWRPHTGHAPGQSAAPAHAHGAYFYPHASERIATGQRTNPLAFRADTAWKAVPPVARCEYAHDYVMDARWHPQHPAVFAQADTGGHLDMFHVCEGMERPRLSATAPRGVHRLAWERAPLATRLAAGCMDGHVHVYQVPEHAVDVRGDADVDALQRCLA